MRLTGFEIRQGGLGGLGGSPQYVEQEPDSQRNRLHDLALWKMTLIA